MLNVKSSTPSYMVYGELGLKPLECEIKSRMIMYWGKMLIGKREKLSYILYNIIRQKHAGSPTSFKWMSCILKILSETGFYYLWVSENQEYEDPYVYTEIKTRINDQYIQTIRSDNASF